MNEATMPNFDFPCSTISPFARVSLPSSPFLLFPVPSCLVVFLLFPVLSCLVVLREKTYGRASPPFLDRFFYLCNILNPK